MRTTHGRNIPIFIVAHSMGGMIAIRTVILHPNVFRGMVLVGPLVIPGTTILGAIDFRVTPFRAIGARLVLKLFDMWNPELVLGFVDYDLVTREDEIKQLMAKDSLRWQGGLKVSTLHT